jgi:hypothetical protein
MALRSSWFKLGVASILMLPFSQAHAERKTDYSAAIDLMAGAGNQLGSTGFNVQEGMAANGSIYPSVTIRSQGEHSALDFNYGFGADHYFYHPAVTTTSHTLTTTLTTDLGKRLHLNLSDTFRKSSDSSMMNVIKGFAYISIDFQYAFEPQLVNRSTISNSASLGLDIDLNSQSFLTFGASGSILSYTGTNSSSGNLSDQTRIEGSFTYSHRTSRRQTLGMRYTVYQNNFQNNPTVRSHSASFVYDRELRPTIQLSLDFGPSYTEKTQSIDAYAGYVASVNVSKIFHSNRFTFYFSHRSGDSTGLGSVTDSNQGGLSFSRALWRTTSLNLDASAFRQNQPSTRNREYWGASGSASLSRSLGRHLALSLGASYQTYEGDQAGSGNYTYKRFFVSFGYRTKPASRG